MSQLTVYGLNSCDTCRKAKKWLESQAIEFHYCDVRKDGLEATELNRWFKSEFAERLINRQSTTWRQLSDEQKEWASSAPTALLLEHPALLKRPVFTRDEEVLAVGFKADSMSAVLQSEAGST